MLGTKDNVRARCCEHCRAQERPQEDPKKNRCKSLIARLLCRNDPNSVAKTYGALAFSGSALARYSID